MRSAVRRRLQGSREVEAALSRRGFLAITAVVGGGLALGVACRPAGSGEASAATAGTPPDPSPDVFLRIEPDDTTVVTVTKSELGQAVRTTIAMFIAEELDADWDKVRAEAASYDPKYGEQGTGGSGSVLGTHSRLRIAAASLRQMLLAAAAKQLGVPVTELRTERSTVVHDASKRTLRYGALAAAAMREPIPANVPLRKPADWKVLGKERTGIDVSDISHGRARYGIDFRREGMVFASVERASTFGATVKSFDASAALRVPGVTKVFEVKPELKEVGIQAGVVVVANTTYAAMQGRRALRVQWDLGEHAAENTASYRAFMQAAVEKPGAEVVNRIGDPDGVLAKATDVIRADYEAPFISHATMEPQNCTAQFTNGKVEVWSPTQFPDWATSAIAKHLGLEASAVKVHVMPLIGGGFGRRINPDFSVEAAVIARELAGTPVQVLWTREDDMRHDFYRPCALHRMEATLGADGNPVAWRHRMSSPAIDATGGRTGEFGASESDGASNHVYRVPNRACEYTLLASGVPRGWWRAVTTTHATFALECFIDELAVRAGKDPYEYRMGLIDRWIVEKPRDSKEYPFNPDRYKAVLKLAAEKAGWGKPLPPGHGVGIATNVPDHLTYCAEVVEASVDNGKVRVHRVVVAVDCGRVFNPNGARAQLEGGVVQAMSAALKERITIERGAVVEGNFDRYQILRTQDTPTAIECHFLESDDVAVTGLGEPSVPPFAPALANAIANATGKRVRAMPFDLRTMNV